ncbi:MAG: hypothetical protein ACHP8A_13595 [Terriglobales bacterium]|jgi:hypothetical protein
MANRNNQARPDELGKNPGQVGSASAGQSGDTQGLSDTEDASDLSVDELTEEDQAVEAGIVDGVEDAANHPERPAHNHVEYRRPEDIAPENGSE